MHQHNIAALNAKYTKKLANAKAKNNALHNNIAANHHQLHIKAIYQSMHKATTASSINNAASPQLANTAKRNYFTLKKKLITMQKQLKKTQKYINKQCK